MTLRQEHILKFLQVMHALKLTRATVQYYYHTMFRKKIGWVPVK